MTPYQLFLSSIDIIKTYKERYMCCFAGTYLNIEFAQQLVAFFCDPVKTLLQQVVGERSHKKKEFSATNLLRMLTVYEPFSNKNILLTPSTKLTWNHFVTFLYLKQDFYTDRCCLARMIRGKK